MGKKNTVSTANTTTATTVKGNKRNTVKGNTTAPANVPAPEQSTTVQAPKPAPVNWARLPEQVRGELVQAVRALFPSINALKKADNKGLIIEQGITVTRGEQSTVYRFNDRGYLSLLKAVKDTRKGELKADIKTLKSGYDFARALYDRFVWAMGMPQYSTYCHEIEQELGEVTPDTVQSWVDKFFPYQDSEHNIMFPVWVCPVATAKTPGIKGRCARMLLYPEQFTVGTAQRVFTACIDNWGKLASKAIGVAKDYTAPTVYTHATVLQVCKFDTATGVRGEVIKTPGTDFVTAHGAGELTTVTRWRNALKTAREQ